MIFLTICTLASVHADPEGKPTLVACVACSLDPCPSTKLDHAKDDNERKNSKKTSGKKKKQRNILGESIFSLVVVFRVV